MTKFCTISVFAPATIANVGAAFDVLGVALQSPGDEVRVARRSESGIQIESIVGDGGVLPYDPEKNTAAVSVAALLRHLYPNGDPPGISITISKGLPIGSGLGSSSASSVAAVVAANELLGAPLSRAQLLPFAMEGERIACGTAHADNVAPSLLGGFTLIRSYDPLDLIPLPSPPDIFFTIVTPDVEVKTSDARRILKSSIQLKHAISQWGNVAALIVAIFKNDPELFGRALQDHIIEPTRSALIPGFHQLRECARSAGALGFAISGSGPTMFAVSSTRERAHILQDTLHQECRKIGLQGTTFVSSVNSQGATVTEAH